MQKIIIKERPDLMAEEGAWLFAEYSETAIRVRGRFIVAVSGGSTPRTMHRLLASGQFRTRIKWDNVYMFWVDERCVPYDDPDSNYGTLKQDMLDHIDIPDSQVFPMPVSGDPETGADVYHKKLSAFFHIPENSVPIFDAIFLGIGRDGHTASLFPGQEALRINERSIVAVHGGEPKVNRLTMTYPVINNAREIVLMAKGLEKAKVIRSVIEDRDIHLPATGVVPVSGRLVWIMDREAASFLQKE